MDKQQALQRVLERLDQITGKAEPVAADRLELAVFQRLDQVEKIVSSIQRYLPKRVIDKILLNPDGVKVEGERRPVTVLFGDLSGFTAMSETMDPEQVVEVVNQYFDTMVEIAERYGGHIDKFMGDALMVLFGAPVVHEDDSLRACLAAIEMLEAMDRFSAERKMDLAMSIGLNTGEVVALNVGSKSRMEYTVIGDGVNLAARLEKVATARQCVIGENTFRQVKGKIRLKKLKPVMVKGKSKPQNVYLILGRTETAETAAGLRAGSIPMVGRMAEMDSIRAAVGKAKDGVGRVVAITGGPGLGKSRLAKELELLARDEQFTFAKGKCYSYAAGMAYLPFLRQLHSLLGIQEKDAPGKKKEKLVERLQALDRSDFEPFLGSLMGIAYPEIADLDPEKRKRRTFEGFTSLFHKEAARQPLALAFEDLQWADSLSLELLEHIVETVGDKPVLVCCDYRPELALPFIARPFCTSLVLEPLGQREVFQMMSSLAGTTDVSDQVLGKVSERTEGNPLFIEEITRHLLSRRLVKREGENLVPAKRFGAMALPNSVAGVVLGRIDKLSEDLRRTLQYAAVIGKEFDHELLGHITKTPAEQLRSQLDNLEHFEGLLYSKEVEGKRLYQFHSTTTQEAAYGTLLKGRRLELHGGVAQTYERDYKDNLEPWLEDLAHHFFHSKFEDKAVQYLHRAGDKAKGLYANAEAIEFYQKGITVLKMGKGTVRDKAELADLIGTQGTIHRLLGDLEMALKGFGKAVAIAKTINDDKLKLKYRLESGVVHHIQGDIPGALRLWKQNYTEASKQNDEYDSAVALGNIGLLYLRIGQAEKASEALRSALTLQEKLGNTKEIVRLTGSIAQVHEMNGDLQGAVQHFRRALELAKGKRYLESVAALNNELSGMMMATGDIEAALEYANECLAIARRIGDKRNEGVSLGTIGTINAMTGRYPDAMKFFSDALAAANTVGDPTQQVALNINIGCVYQLWGDTTKALEHHRAAVVIAQAVQDLANLVEAKRNIGLDHALVGRYADAHAELTRAAELARDAEDPRIAAYVDANLGALLAALGQTEQARATLDEALGGARQVGDPEVILAAVRGMVELGLQINDLAQAREQNARALRISDETQNAREKAYALMNQTAIGKADGDAEAMAAPLAEALQIAMEIDDQVLRVKLDLLAAEKAMISGNFAESEKTLKELESSGRVRAMPDLLWRVYWAKAQLYKRQGRDDGAKEQLALARRTVDGMKPQVPEGMWDGFINNAERKLVYQALG